MWKQYLMMLGGCIAIYSSQAHINKRQLHIKRKPAALTPLQSRPETCTAWASYYQRDFDEFYDKKGQQVPLSQGIFQRQPFTLTKVLPISQREIEQNPFTAISQIDPHVRYAEQGAICGIQFKRNISEDGYRIGFHAHMPVSQIMVHHTPQSSRGEQLSDVAIQRDGLTRDSYAFRFDFLHQLRLVPTREPLVNCNRTPLRIVQIDATQTAGQCNVPVVMLAAPQGIADNQLLAATQSQAASADILPQDPKAIAGVRNRFGPQTSYEAFCRNIPQTRKWFLTPTVCNGRMDPDARIIQTYINNSIQSIEQSIEPALARRGISLANRQETHVGDLDVHLTLEQALAYYSWSISPGVRIPTGKKRNPLYVFDQPTGNNGHVETLIDIEGSCTVSKWAYIRGYGRYAHSFDAIENRLVNETDIHHIGVPACICTSWDYGIIYGELGICPHESILFHIGYEGYLQSKEDVRNVTPSELAVTPQKIAQPSANAHSLHLDLHVRWNGIDLFAQYVPMLSGEHIAREVKTWSVGMLITF